MSKFKVGEYVMYKGVPYLIKEVWCFGVDTKFYAYILDNHPDNCNYPNLIPERFLKKDPIYIQISLF